VGRIVLNWYTNLEECNNKKKMKKMKIGLKMMASDWLINSVFFIVPRTELGVSPY